MILNKDRTLNLREEDQTDEIEDFDRVSTVVPDLNSTNSENIYLLVDLKAPKESSTIGFFSSNNQQVELKPKNAAPLNYLKFSFRTRSNVTTLLEFDRISLNIDVDGYLALVDRDKQVQRLRVNDQQKPINDGHLYSVHLKRIENQIDGWIIKNRFNPANKVSIELPSASLIVEKLIFAGRNQFVGCVENVVLNDETLSIEHLDGERRKCPSSSVVLKSNEILVDEQIFIDQMISFKEFDRPLIADFDKSIEFQSFSFRLFTQESNSVIASLTDQTFRQYLTLSVQNKYLFITLDKDHNKRINILLNKTTILSDAREHQIQIKFINEKEFQIEIDAIDQGKYSFTTFLVHRIYLGQIDGFLKEFFPENEADYFVGCLKDVTFNQAPLIKLEHIHHIERLMNTCPLSKRGRKFDFSSYSID